MAIETQGAPGLNYTAFKKRLSLEGFSKDQSGPLKLRLDLLESFMEPLAAPGGPAASRTKPGKHERKRLAAAEGIWAFKPGTLTIVDLSCPFVDRDAACVLFDICLNIFLETRNDAGRVVALDEAHKVCLSHPHLTSPSLCLIFQPSQGNCY